MIALFAATADMGKGDIGLCRGARRLYRADLSQLDDRALNCLVEKALGKPIYGSYIPGKPAGRYPNCPTEWRFPPVH